MTAEKLLCTCGREVRIVRLNSKLLTLGHTTNPTYQSHPVRLARTTDERPTRPAGRQVGEDTRRSSEGPARSVSPSEREARESSVLDGLGAGPSTDPVLARAVAQPSRPLPVPGRGAHAGISNSRPVRARRVDRVVIPPDRPSASRPERLGLRSTPGEQA